MECDFLGRKRPFLGRRVGNFPALGPAAKTGEFCWGRDSGRCCAEFYRAAAAGLRIRASDQLAVEQTITGGFSSKRYRRGTPLVQEHPATGWIWRSWNEREKVGCSDKTLSTSTQAPGQVPAISGSARAVACLMIRARCSSRQAGGDNLGAR